MVQRAHEMSVEDIKQRIADISAAMKGSMPDLERALLHEDRKELRTVLTNLERAAIENLRHNQQCADVGSLRPIREEP